MSLRDADGGTSDDLSAKPSARRKSAIRGLQTTLGLLDAEFIEARAIRWVIGGPLLRFERFKGATASHAALLTAAEQAELLTVLEAYGNIFEAVALFQRTRSTVRADEPVVLTAEIRRQLESARGATQTLYETLADGDARSA